MPQSYTPVLSQDALRRLWHGGQEGRLSAWEVAKALGLREASKELHDGTLNLPWVAQRLKKIGGGRPSTAGLLQLYAKIDADPDWFPGKHTGAKRGPKPLFNSAKRRCVAESMMAQKRNRGEDPSVEAAILNCPKATMNPKTHWLSNPLNVVQIHLDAPAWQHDPSLLPHVNASVSQRGNVRRMTSDALYSFLVTQDLAGPAEVLRANAVNGADFLTLTETDYQRELRMTPFASKKLARFCRSLG